MRVSTIACLLLALSTPALAANGIVVSKKVTTLEKTDKALTKIKVLVAVPDVLSCFGEAAEIDVDIDSDGKTILVTTDQSNKDRASCLEAAFKKIKVKTTSGFKARIHLAAKVDARQKKKDEEARNQAILKSLDSQKFSSISNLTTTRTGTGTGTGVGTGTGGGGNASDDFETASGMGTGGGGTSSGDFVKGSDSSAPSAVSMGTPGGSYGDYTAEEIQRVFKAHAGALRACYQVTLKTEPKLSGKWTYDVKIDTTGAVASVKLKSSTAKSTKLDDCLQRQLKAFKFPAKSGATVTYPFMFVQS